MRSDIIPPDIIEVIDGGGETDGAGNVGRAGFEFGGCIE